MIHEHRHLLDWAVWLCAGVALISLSQLAFVLTCIATLLSIVLGCVRLHDRVKYGPARGRE